jgi:hypothetical protein
LRPDLMSILVEWPLLALVPGVVLALMFSHCRRRLVLAASLSWVVYALYELANRLRITCSGECNIRVDLLLIYPLLAAVTLAAVVSWAMSLIGRGRRQAAR